LKDKRIPCPQCQNTYAHALALRRHQCHGPAVPPRRPSEPGSGADGHISQETDVTEQRQNVQEVAANETISSSDGQSITETDAAERTQNTQLIADSMHARIEDACGIVLAPRKLIHQCPYCVDMFRCKGNLRLHVRYNHPPAKL